MPTIRPIVLALIAALAASACQRDADAPSTPPAASTPAPAADAPAAPPTAEAASSAPVAYDCGGTAVEATFDGDRATVIIDGESIALQTVPSASGARYQGTRADGVAVELWTKGGSATLSVAGNAYPECTTSAASADAAQATWRARGNEPFWLVELSGTALALTTPEAPDPVQWTAAARSERTDGFDVSATREGGALSLSATTALCRDTMTGMPYPQTVSLRIDDRESTGCGGEPIDLLAAHEWTVSTIGGTAAVERAPTLTFQRDGNANGYAGCNRWMGPAALTGEGLGFARAATTMMACPEEAMKQERAFLDALAKVTRHDFDEAGNLLLKAGDETVIVAAPSS